MKKLINPNSHDLINLATSMNYTCLKASLQDEVFGNGVYGRDEIFAKKTLKNTWHDAKMKGLTEERTRFFSHLRHDIKAQFNPELYAKDDELSQDFLMVCFNKFYGTNKKFEECFSGFEILDPHFKSVFERFDHTATISEQNLNLNYTIKAYYTYLSAHIDHLIVDAFKDIIVALQDDFAENGYKSYHYGNPANTAISKLTKADLDKLLAIAHPAIESVIAQIAPLEKELEALQQQTNFSPMNADQAREQTNLVLQIKPLSIKKTKLSQLASYLEALYKRLESATKEVNKSFLTNLTETFMDFISGTPKDNPSVDWTYIHDNERELLEYFIKQAGLSSPYKKQEKPQTEVGKSQENS